MTKIINNITKEDLYQLNLPKVLNITYEDVIHDTILILNIDKEKESIVIKYGTQNPITITIDSFILGNYIDYIYDDLFYYAIGTHLITEKRDFTIIDRKITFDKNNNKVKNYKIHCNKCTYEFWRNENKIKNCKDGCACCCATPQVVVPGINDITTTDQWMIPYFQGGAEEASRYTSKSSKKIYPKCPDCGKIRNKLIAIHRINKYGSIGCECGDKKSYPNKFSYAFLEQLPIKNWETEYHPKWLHPYFYDNYFEYNGQAYVLEMDGELGHGNKQYKDNKWIKDEDGIARDIIKDNLAKTHNIVVIRIDTQCSSKEYISQNILSNQILIDIFGESILKTIDWDLCNLKATKNIIKEVCEFWENNNHCEYKILQEKFHINYIGTIQNYLKKGTELGWCNYNKEKYRKERQEKSFGKTISVFLSDGTFIKEYVSKQRMKNEIENDLGIKYNATKINEVINGVSETYKGFIFKEKGV